MKLSREELSRLKEVAETAALKAGEYIKSFPRNQLSVLTKQGGENLAAQVVTQVDIAAQKIILNHLNPLTVQHDFGVLTEELEDDGSRFRKDHFWCIDPLDGTLPFIEGTAGCSVSIALVERVGIPIVGVIYDFVNDNLYSAGSGFGVKRNGLIFELKKTETGKFTLVYDRSFQDTPQYSMVRSQLLREYREIREIGYGGAALNAVWVLENAPAQYAKAPKIELGGGSFWDYAASACIFNEIGARAETFTGEPLSFAGSSTHMNEVGIFYSA